MLNCQELVPSMIPTSLSQKKPTLPRALFITLSRRLQARRVWPICSQSKRSILRQDTQSLEPSQEIKIRLEYSCCLEDIDAETKCSALYFSSRCFRVALCDDCS